MSSSIFEHGASLIQMVVIGSIICVAIGCVAAAAMMFSETDFNEEDT